MRGKRKSRGGGPRGSPIRHKRKTVAVNSLTEIEETPPNSDMDEPQVEGYIKVELDPELEPGRRGNNEEVLFGESTNQVLAGDPDIDIGPVDVKVLRYPEDELIVQGGDEGNVESKKKVTMIDNSKFEDLHEAASSSKSSERKVNEKKGKRKMSAKTHDENIDLDAPTPLNEDLTEVTSSASEEQMLPDAEAVTDSDSETQQTLELFKKQIKNIEMRIRSLQQKIREKKKRIKMMRTIPFQTSHKEALLHRAVSKLDEKVVLHLIADGANVNVKNSIGETPLSKAVSEYSGNASIRIIKILIEKGSDLIIKSDSSSGDMFLNLLFDALEPSQFHDLVEFLIGRNLSEIFNAPSHADSEATPLQLAVRYLDVKPATLKMLHVNGVNFKAVDKYGKSVLGYAMRANRSSTVMANLVKFGADHRSLGRWKESVLFYAVVGDDMDALKYFLTFADLDINTTNYNGDTPLHFAMKSKSKNLLQTAQLLISKKANMKIVNKKLQTALHVGAQNEKIVCSDVIQLLIDSGAEPFAKDKKNCTFLHYLILNDTLTPSEFHKVVEYLQVKECIKLFHQVNKDGLTLLHLALQNINMEASTLAILHKQGSLELEMLPDAIITHWLNRIATRGNAKALNYLVTQLGLDVSHHQNFWDNNLLHQVVLYGSHNVLEEVAMLILENHRKNGQDIIHFKNKGGATPLDIAIKRQNMMDKYKVIDLLRNGINSEYYINCTVELGGNRPQSQLAPVTMNDSTSEESSSMDMANNSTDDNQYKTSSLTMNQANEPEAVKKCRGFLEKKKLELGHLINDFSKLFKEVRRFRIVKQSGGTELDLAIEQKDDQAVLELIRNGANVNCRDKEGCTPLHNAARWMSSSSGLKIIKHLVEEGADIYAVNQAGYPFYFYLPNNTTPDQFHEIALILAGRNADGVFNMLFPSEISKYDFPVTGFQEIIRKIDVREATLAILPNVHLNAIDEDKLQKSVLWYAVTEGRSPATVKGLVKFGANPKYLTSWNENLLFGAAQAGRIDLFQYFLSLGLDINAPNKCGNTPLHYVMNSVTQLLIRNGANPNLKNKFGETPLHFAAYRIEDTDTCIAVIKELLNNGAFPFAVDQEGHSFLEHLIHKYDPPLISSQFQAMIHYIIAKGYTALFRIPHHEDPDINPLRMIAFTHVLERETLSLLLENGILVNVGISNYNKRKTITIDSLIYWAALGHNVEGLKILIKFRRDVNNDDGGDKTVKKEVDELIKMWGLKGGGIGEVVRNHPSTGQTPSRLYCCGGK